MPHKLNITAAEVERAARADSELGLLALAFASGRVRATVTSARTGGQIPVKLTCKRRRPSGSGWEICPLRDAERVFVDQPLGGDQGDSSIGTLYPFDDRAGQHAGTFFYATNVDAARVWAARFVLEAAAGRDLRWDQAEIDVGNRCVLCGRELNRSESIRRMMGPDCYVKATGIVGVDGHAHEHGEGFAPDSAFDCHEHGWTGRTEPCAHCASLIAGDREALRPAETAAEVEARLRSEAAGGRAFPPAVAPPRADPAPAPSEPDVAPQAAPTGLIAINPGEPALDVLARLDQEGTT